MEKILTLIIFGICSLALLGGLSHSSVRGNGKIVAIEVLDARNQEDLAERKNIEQGVLNKLKNYDFNPIIYSSNDHSISRLLRITIKDVEYKETTHAINSEIVISSSIDVNASNNEENYMKHYQQQKIISGITTPSESQDQLYFNEVNTDTLEELLADKVLLKFLAN